MAKILVVENGLKDHHSVSEILAKAGYNTEVAENADGTMERVSRGDITMVVVDIDRINASGLQLVHKLRNLSEYVSIILMTPHASEHTMMEAFRLGADEVLETPVQSGELLSRVSMMMMKKAA